MMPPFLFGYLDFLSETWSLFMSDSCHDRKNALIEENLCFRNNDREFYRMPPCTFKTLLPSFLRIFTSVSERNSFIWVALSIHVHQLVLWLPFRWLHDWFELCSRAWLYYFFFYSMDLLVDLLSFANRKLRRYLCPFLLLLYFLSIFFFKDVRV